MDCMKKNDAKTNSVKKRNKQVAAIRKEAFSIPEAGKCLGGIGKDLIYSEINAGRLPSIKIGKRRLIRREACEQWLASREAETTRGMGFGTAAQGE